MSSRVVRDREDVHPRVGGQLPRQAQHLPAPSAEITPRLVTISAATTNAPGCASRSRSGIIASVVTVSDSRVDPCEATRLPDDHLADLVLLEPLAEQAIGPECKPVLHGRVLRIPQSLARTVRPTPTARMPSKTCSIRLAG